MGNRAVITDKNKQFGIYLHWHGSPIQVHSFLKYCELANFREPTKDYYGWARLCQIISNYLGYVNINGNYEGLSIGIGDISEERFLDNGIYIIDGWNIIKHEDEDGNEIIDDEFDTNDIVYLLNDINDSQPNDLKQYMDKIILEKYYHKIEE